MPRSRARARGVGAGIRRTVPSRPPSGVWRVVSPVRRSRARSRWRSAALGRRRSPPGLVDATWPAQWRLARVRLARATEPRQIPVGRARGTVQRVGELRMPVVWAPATDAHRVDTGVWCGVTIENDELPERAHVLLEACRAAGAPIVPARDHGLDSAGGGPRRGVPGRAADRPRALGRRWPPGRPGRAVRRRLLGSRPSPGVTEAIRPGRPRRSAPSSVATRWTP